MMHTDEEGNISGCYRRRSFQYFDCNTFISYIGVQRAIRRCHLEIAVSVWASHYEYLIEFSEGVQRKAAEMLPGLKGKYLSYLL